MITARIDAITAIPPERRCAHPPAPKSVKIEISPRCNYRCGFCALRTREQQPTRDMDLAFFQRITRDMRDAGVEEIGLFYLGESTMAPTLLVACLQYLKQTLGMPYVFLTSNGSLATPSLVDALMRGGLDSLKWSVNAATPEQFATVMGVSAKLFWRALDHIRMAWTIRNRGAYQTRLAASSIRYDDEQHARMEHLLSNRVRPYVDEHYWLPLYSMGSFAAQREAELGYRPIAGNQGRLGALREPLPCWSVFTEGHVTADGKLSACCFDANGRWTMGDLHDQSFLEAWQSDTFADLRAAHLRGDVRGTICESCVAYA